MLKRFQNKIQIDLKESHIDWKVALFFIPVAFFTYYFHESGHWLFGEIRGNRMSLSLNNCAPLNTVFQSDQDAIWSAIGGPLFTIGQALLFTLITWRTKSIYPFTAVFFAVFTRFFSLLLGGFARQDEAGIARLLGYHSFVIAIGVLSVLTLILWQNIRMIGLNAKAVGYFTTLSVLANLMVIGTANITHA